MPDGPAYGAAHCHSGPQLLCCGTVQQYGGALKYLPEALNSPALCADAVRCSCLAVHFVPEPLRTPAIAVRLSGGTAQRSGMC